MYTAINCRAGVEICVSNISELSSLITFKKGCALVMFVSPVNLFVCLGFFARKIS